MNVTRYNQDLRLLQEFFGPGNITWSNRPGDLFLVIKNLPLTDNVRPNVTALKILVPPTLYDPTGRGRFHFYGNLYVDPALQVRRSDGKWGPVPRHHDAPVAGNDAGWRFLCVYPPGTVGPKGNAMLLVRQVQVWFKNCLQLNRGYF